MVDISRHLEKAREAEKKKNFPFAIQLYHQMLAMKPDDEEARRGLHTTLESYGRYRSGNLFLSFLSTLGPRISIFFARLGKNHPGQARGWEKVLAAAPNDRGALRALSHALERAGYLRSAQVAWEHLGRVTGDDGEPWRRAGDLRHRLGDREGALEAYEKALAANPRDQEALRSRKNLAAEGALERSSFRSASSSRELIKDEDKAKELERSQRLVHSADSLDDELASLEDKLAEKPEDAGLLLRKSQVLRKLGRREEALELLAGLRDRNEAGFEGLRLLGDLRIEGLEEKLARAGEGEESRRLAGELKDVREEVARDLVNAHPTDARLRLRLGEALQESGRLDEAIAEFQNAGKDPRFRSETTIKLARAFRAKGLADLALSQYRKALEWLEGSGDRHRETLYELGDLLEEKGEKAEALQVFSRIYEADITFKDVSARIDRLRGEG